jgi:anti-sigma-K factor RskA
VSERPPDFDQLVGDDLGADERERLQRVHNLLVSAGPPPEAPERAPVVPLARRRRRGALLAVAAALAVAAFAFGVAVGNESGGRTTDFVVEMSGAGEAAASLTVYELDEAGNWPMEMEVEGLAPAGSGRPFELWLTKGGELEAFCGSFATADDGSARVPLNAPWRLDDFDGWVVVEEGTTAPVLAT